MWIMQKLYVNGTGNQCTLSNININAWQIKRKRRKNGGRGGRELLQFSLHRGHPLNVPIRRRMHLSSVIPANDTRESMFGHQNFPPNEQGSDLGSLAPETMA